jgi:hypothetical protein
MAWNVFCEVLDWIGHKSGEVYACSSIKEEIIHQDKIIYCFVVRTVQFLLQSYVIVFKPLAAIHCVIKMVHVCS